MPSLSRESLDILLNENILKINQDPLSIAVAPFAPLASVAEEGDDMPTHWYGPLSTGETVLMIINTSKKPMDIHFRWRDIPGFKSSPAKMFSFTEISGRAILRSKSRSGFVYYGVPPHGSVVMQVSEDNGTEDNGMEWATAQADW